MTLRVGRLRPGENSTTAKAGLRRRPPANSATPDTATSGFDAGAVLVGAMEHVRLRKYRGPEVWRRVREAYVAGESGPSLARRFDVGLANLRKKASREDWTRSAAAAEIDRGLPEIVAAEAATGAEEPVDRRAALSACLDHAAAAMAAGEGQRALAGLKAALAFTELTRRLDDPGYQDPTEPGRQAALAFLRAEALRDYPEG